MSLELGVVGNGSVGALIDARARVVWMCLPAFDGDPTFCALLEPREGGGDYTIEVEDFVESEQHYLDNTAVLVTTLRDRHGGVVEVTDACPRFKQHGRYYHPMMLVRRLRPLAGQPRVRIRLRPRIAYGAQAPERSFGSNHLRFVLDGFALRLTTDGPLPLIRDEVAFLLDRDIALVLGPDETLTQPPAALARDHLDRTADYWRTWVRGLSLPFDWQEAVIRAAITLKMCQYEGSGAIIAAMTTSIPEHAGSERTWDYRYCWLRDAAFVVRALNRLGATRSMVEYLRFIFNVAAGRDELAPLYGIHFQTALHERYAESLAGYRGTGPVRVGNDAWRQRQHDAYGSVLMASAQLFFDRRLAGGDAATFGRLEPLGHTAARLWNEPDAGLWEYRGRQRVHTYSSTMCWVACERLGRIADRLGLTARATHWHGLAAGMREAILERAWNPSLRAFVEDPQDARLDASSLLFADLGLVRRDDPRYVSTVEVIGRELKRGRYLFRYRDPDDFGTPRTAFNLCTFWYVDALAMVGRVDEAREHFDEMLSRRTALGLLSEDLDPATGEPWGNFPQTYSLVGLINAAMRLSRRWEDMV